MAKLNMICKRRPESRWKSETQKGGRRFYTSVDMSELKHMTAIRNAEIKRGLIVDKANNGICVCGCGNEGCFILYNYDNRTI